MFYVIVLLGLIYWWEVSLPKRIARKERRGREIEDRARMVFNRNIKHIEQYIKGALPEMKGGINKLNEMTLSSNCTDRIIEEDSELKGSKDFQGSPEYMKLHEMVSAYVSFLVDKHVGGMGSSASQLEYKHGQFLKDNDIQLFYYDKESKKLI